MALRLANLLRPTSQAFVAARCMSTGEYGSGSGRGGGSGGSIRDAGGSLGKREAALEDQYFRKLSQEQLQNIHQHLHNSVEEMIKYHENAVETHKQTLAELKKLTGKKD